MKGLKAGADAYISKPFSSVELLALVENLIWIRRMLQERIKTPDWMETREPVVRTHDAEFLKRVQHVVREHLGDYNFGVDWLADEIGLSSRQLQRRMQTLTRLSAAGLIKAMRLEEAARMLRDGDFQVSEVSRAVGYEDTNYFSRLFRQAYGVPPSEFARRTQAPVVNLLAPQPALNAAG